MNGRERSAQGNSMSGTGQDWEGHEWEEREREGHDFSRAARGLNKSGFSR